MPKSDSMTITFYTRSLSLCLSIYLAPIFSLFILAHSPFTARALCGKFHEHILINQSTKNANYIEWNQNNASCIILYPTHTTYMPRAPCFINCKLLLGCCTFVEPNDGADHTMTMMTLVRK